MKKLITFSLWGDDPKYTQGAIRNAELAPKIYPGWTCRFYIGSSVPFSVTEKLTQITKRWIRYATVDDDVTAICGGTLEHVDPELQIYHVNEPGDWTGMFWRFEPASEDDVEVFISRDCDSRLNEREAVAVNEWMKGPKLIHVMRDHPYHAVPILGGMWGAKFGAIPDMKQMIAGYNREDKWQTDQFFLRDRIWPAHYHKILAHDNWGRYGGTEIKRFTQPRVDNEFVGAIIGVDEQRLHPEHHALVEGQ